MNRQSWTSLFAVAVVSSVLCTCVTYTDADYYALSQDDARALAADPASPSGQPPEVGLRVDCHIQCEELDVEQGMPLAVWRPNLESVELATFEYFFDGEVIRDLDGELIADVDDVDVFALQVGPRIDERRTRPMERRWIAVGAGAAGLGTLVWASYWILSNFSVPMM